MHISKEAIGAHIPAVATASARSLRRKSKKVIQQRLSFASKQHEQPKEEGLDRQPRACLIGAGGDRATHWPPIRLSRPKGLPLVAGATSGRNLRTQQQEHATPKIARARSQARGGALRFGNLRVMVGRG